MNAVNQAAAAAPDTDAIAMSSGDRPRRPIRLLLGKQAFQIFVILLVIVAIFSVLAPAAFPTWGNVRQIALNASLLAILGVGMTFVIITAGIDLSIGSVLVFSGVVAAKVMVILGGEGWGVALAGILVAMASGTAWGFLNGFLIAKAKIPPLIVTLGTLGMALGFSQILTGGVDIRDVPAVLQNDVGYGRAFGVLPMITVVAIVVVALGTLLLHRTRFGLHTFALGSNAEASRRVGLKVDRQVIAIYAMSGLLAGVTGVLSLAQYGTTAIAGQSATNLAAIAAVVIGGTSLFGGVGTILGTVVGLFIPAVLQNGFIIVGVEPFWQQVAVGAVLIGAVYIDQLRRIAATRGRRPSALRTLVGSPGSRPRPSRTPLKGHSR
jgi:ribose transport system permease protein